MSNLISIMKRYPRLTSHLICESLGYFTPKAAANAIWHYKNNRAFFCEWYSHQASCMGKGLFDEEAVREVGREVISRSFKFRHSHKGYMSDYRHARHLVNRAIEDDVHPDFASWF